MGNTLKGNILLIAPELSSIIDNNVWSLVLSDVSYECDYSTYGVNQERAQRYLSAHYLTLIKQSKDGESSNASGPMTQDKVGDLQRSYQSNSFNDKSRYDETKYGRIFKQIMRSTVTPFMCVSPG